MGLFQHTVTHAEILKLLRAQELTVGVMVVNLTRVLGVPSWRGITASDQMYKRLAELQDAGLVTYSPGIRGKYYCLTLAGIAEADRLP